LSNEFRGSEDKIEGSYGKETNGEYYSMMGLKKRRDDSNEGNSLQSDMSWPTYRFSLSKRSCGDKEEMTGRNKKAFSMFATMSMYVLEMRHSDWSKIEFVFDCY
jgi:hypothetical protein